MNNLLFFDSYAIIEIILGNLGYKLYTQSRIITTKLNLFEVYYSLLRDIGKEEAETVLKKYCPFCIDFNEDDIKKAADIKIKNKRLSMTDCIGYAVAKRLGIKFLTGDKEFEDLENVEFVK